MKTRLITVMLLLIATCVIGQARFEKGYFIDNDNHRVECFIKNNDRKDNPILINYKLEIGAKTWEQVGIDYIKEFGIYGLHRYIRRTVQIDRSSNNINKLTKDKNPDFEQKQLFLQVLVDGKASLYYHTDKGLDRYFYSVSDTSVTQLIYKTYLINNSIGYNNAFRQQLWTDVRCDNAKLNTVENLNYTLQELKKYVINYNNCVGDTTLQVDEQLKVSLFNLKITPGFNLSSMQISDWDFKTKPFLRLGIESEFILPYQRNKWAILLEPSIQYFSSQTNASTIKFNSFEVPFGLRYCSYLGNGSKLFVNGLMIPSFALDFNEQINYHTTKTLDNQGFSYALGAGIEKNRFSLEFRHYTKRKILFSYESLYGEYNRSSIIMGFKLIQSKNKRQNR